MVGIGTFDYLGDPSGRYSTCSDHQSHGALLHSQDLVQVSPSIVRVFAYRYSLRSLQHSLCVYRVVRGECAARCWPVECRGSEPIRWVQLTSTGTCQYSDSSKVLLVRASVRVSVKSQSCSCHPSTASTRWAPGPVARELLVCSALCRTRHSPVRSRWHPRLPCSFYSSSPFCKWSGRKGFPSLSRHGHVACARSYLMVGASQAAAKHREYQTISGTDNDPTDDQVALPGPSDFRSRLQLVRVRWNTHVSAFPNERSCFRLAVAQVHDSLDVGLLCWILDQPGPGKQHSRCEKLDLLIKWPLQGGISASFFV